jgi:hypothetical protein
MTARPGASVPSLVRWRQGAAAGATYAEHGLAAARQALGDAHTRRPSAFPAVPDILRPNGHPRAGKAQRQAGKQGKAADAFG